MALALTALLVPSAFATNQDHSGYRAISRDFETYDVAGWVLDERLSTRAEMRGWAFQLLVAYQLLPDAPRPDGLSSAADLDELWTALVAQPAHADDPADHLALAALPGLEIALFADPEAALDGVGRLLERDGIDDVARGLVLSRAAEAHWFAGRRRDHELALAEAGRALGRAEEATGLAASKARYLFHVMHGVERMRDGRPDLAFDSLERARTAADEVLRSNGEAGPWIRVAIKELDLAHGSDDVELGRRVAARVLAEDPWPSLSAIDRAEMQAAFDWRVAALDFIPEDGDGAAVIAALDGLARLVDDTTLASDFGLDERRIAGRYHVRAAARRGEFKRARSMIDTLASHELLDADEVATLRARVDHAEFGPNPARAEALIAAVRDRIAAWTSAAHERRSQGLLHYDADAELVSLALESLAATRGAEAALELLAEVGTAGTLAVALGARNVTTDEILALVPERGGLLALAPGYQTDHLFLVDADGIDMVRVDDAHRLRTARKALARAHRGLISSNGERSRTFGEIEARASEVAGRLFDEATAARLASWERATIVGLDAWGDAPVEWLPVAGERLGARMELAFAPSLPVAAHLSAGASLGVSDVGLLCALVPDAGPAARAAFPSASALADATDVERRMLPPGAAAARVLRDEAATLDALRAAFGTPVDALVMLGHGVTTGSGAPALLLHGGTQEDGLVTAAVVRELDAPPLVVLASCESSRSVALRGGDGSEALDAAFLAAGASVVVSTEVPLELDAAARQTRAVLDARRLGSGSVARALRDARRAAPDDVGVWSVRAVGDGHRSFKAVESGGPRRGRGLAAAAIVVALAAAAAGAAAAASARARRARAALAASSAES
ncbi:MAG: CHAT domain-containing protein [Planctomycetota bacterium]